MNKIFKEVLKETKRQKENWGVKNHPILDPSLTHWGGQKMCQRYGIPSEGDAQKATNKRAKRGDLTYMDILVEEISEASSASNISELREELIQSTAVLFSMIESLDRNGR